MFDPFFPFYLSKSSNPNPFFFPSPTSIFSQPQFPPSPHHHNNNLNPFFLFNNNNVQPPKPKSPPPPPPPHPPHPPPPTHHPPKNHLRCPHQHQQQLQIRSGDGFRRSRRGPLNRESYCSDRRQLCVSEGG
jgi:hypothetical protein